MIGIFKRLASIDWCLFVRQVFWLLQSAMYFDESTDVYRAIDDDDLEKARALLKEFELLVKDENHPDVVRLRTSIKFWEEVDDEPF